MLIVNFKTYHEATGANAIKLAKIIDKACAKAPVPVLIAVQALDLEKVAKSVKNIKVIAQHIDGVSYGAHTGHILPEEVKNHGGVGTLINHSESPIPIEKLGKSIDLAQSVFPECTIVCSPSYERTVELDRNLDPHKADARFAVRSGANAEGGREAKKAVTQIAKLFVSKASESLLKIAYEPPELIGGDISVSTAKPEIIKKVVGISSERQILVGAGIKTVEDIRISLKLGAIGVLVASGVVRAEDPGKVVKEFLKAWK